MPDSNLADNSVFTSSFYNTYLREQVVITCTSATRPTGVDGRVIYETDTEKFYVYENSAWNLLGGGRWRTYTPTWTNLTVGNGTQSGEYRYVPGGIRVRGELTFGSTTSISGAVTLTISNSETSKASGGPSIGSIRISDTGTQFYIGIAFVSVGVTTMNFYSSAGASITSTSPHTWANTDILSWDVTVAL